MDKTISVGDGVIPYLENYTGKPIKYNKFTKEMLDEIIEEMCNKPSTKDIVIGPYIIYSNETKRFN